MKTYNKRIWLNPVGSRSTGAVVCFDGEVTWKGENCRDTFLQINDCNNSVRLHPTEDDNIKDFVRKLKKLNSEIESFINHLEK